MDYLEYQLPVMKYFSHEISVKNRNRTEVLTIQKQFNTKIKMILGLIIPSFFINIVVKENAEIMAESKDIFTLGRNRWNVEFKTEGKKMGVIRLQDTRILRTHPRASFYIGSDHYKLERAFRDKTTSLKLENEIIAELFYDKRMPPRTNTIKLYKNDLNIPLIVCVFHTFDLTN